MSCDCTLDSDGPGSETPISVLCGQTDIRCDADKIYHELLSLGGGSARELAPARIC